MNGPPQRYALGLPSGSVRAILTLLIVGLVCALLLIPDRPRIPMYLMYLLLLGVTQFFAALGAASLAPGERPPLGLPAGTVRLVIMAALTATIVYRLTVDFDSILGQLKQSVVFATEHVDLGALSPLFLPFLLLAGFFVGVIVRRIVGVAPAAVIQDLQGWLALLCVVGMSIEMIIQLVINPSLARTEDMPKWGGVLSTFIAFYYGARS